MYQDSTSVEVESLAGLRLYSEVKPLVSVGVILTWVYLMTFRDSAVPEKQQIEIRIHTRPVRSHTMEMPSFRDAISGKISYRISYTARTWGADIENLLRDHIESLILEERSAIRRSVRRWKSYVMNFVALALYSIFLRLGFAIEEWIIRQGQPTYNEISASGINKIDQIIRKLDYIHDKVASPAFIIVVSVSVLYLGGALILSYVIAGVTTDDLARPRPSFVLLTRNAENAKMSELANHEKRWTVFIGTFIFAVIAGIVGNVVTWIIWG